MKCPFCGELLDTGKQVGEDGRLQCDTCHAFIRPDWVVSDESASAAGPHVDSGAANAAKPGLATKPASPRAGTYSFDASKVIQDNVAVPPPRTKDPLLDHSAQQLLNVESLIEDLASKDQEGAPDVPFESILAESEPPVEENDPLAPTPNPEAVLGVSFDGLDDLLIDGAAASTQGDAQPKPQPQGLDIDFGDLPHVGIDLPQSHDAEPLEISRPQGKPDFDDDVFGGTDFELPLAHDPSDQLSLDDDGEFPLPPGWDKPVQELVGLGQAVDSVDLAADFGENLFTASGGLDLDIPINNGHPESAPASATNVNLPSPMGRTAKKPAPPVAKALLVVVALIAVIGAILGQTEYGYFGMNLFLGKKTTSSAAPAAFKPVDEANLKMDRRENYEADIVRLERFLKEQPDNREVASELYLLLLRYQERFPLAASADPGIATKIRDLTPRADLTGNLVNVAKTIRLMAEGKFDEALDLISATATSGEKDSLVYYLQGRIHLKQMKWAQAITSFEQALQLENDDQASRFFLARSYIGQKKFKSARGVLETLLAAVPNHLGAMAAMAEVELADKNLDAAVTMAAQVINTGKAGYDSQEQFTAYIVMADVEGLRGNDEARMMQLRAALGAQPKDEATAITLGKILLTGGKRGEAFAALRPCKELGNNSEEFLKLFVQAAHADEQDDVAEQAIREGAELYPTSAVFPNLSGELELARGLNEAASQAFEKAIKMDPTFVDAYLNLADVKVSAGRLSEAAEVLALGVEAVPQSIELLLQLAKIRTEKQEFPEAEASLVKLLELDPDHFAATRLLGHVLEAQGKFAQVVTALAALEKKGGLDRDSAICLGRAYLATRQSKEAVEILQNLHSAEAPDWEASAEYGRALFETGDMAGAEEVLNTVVVEDPSQGSAFHYLGRLYAASGRSKEAVEALKEASRLEPRRNSYRIVLATELLKLGDKDSLGDAKVQLDQVISTYERDNVPAAIRDYRAWALRGDLLMSEGKYPFAQKDFVAALELAPGRVDLLFKTGLSLLEQSRHDDAVVYFKQVLNKEPKHAGANYYSGVIAVRNGQLREAQRFMETASERDPEGYPESLMMLGRIHRDFGRFSEANKAFERFLKYKSTGPEADEARQLLGRRRAQ